MQPFSEFIWSLKYQLKDKNNNPVDFDIDSTKDRVANALAQVEVDRVKWEKEFRKALDYCVPAGRIMSNAGAEDYKTAVSLINCTVSDTINDDMGSIFDKLSEAALTLKAGCVYKNTKVITEKGVVSVQKAVKQKHKKILSYNKKTREFEFKSINKHMTVVVPKSDNIKLITQKNVSLTTSKKHPILVYKDGKLKYEAAGNLKIGDLLVHYSLPLSSVVDDKLSHAAWFSAAHLADGNAKEVSYDYKSHGVWEEKSQKSNGRYLFTISAEKSKKLEVVKKYSKFFELYCDTNTVLREYQNANNTTMVEFSVKSFNTSEAANLIDYQLGDKANSIRVPKWVKEKPELYFMPYLAGCLDTDASIYENGFATIRSTSKKYIEDIETLLGLFGISSNKEVRSFKERNEKWSDLHSLSFKDINLLKFVSKWMSHQDRLNIINKLDSETNQYSKYGNPETLKKILEEESKKLSHKEKLFYGMYHKYHKKDIVSDIWLNKWAGLSIEVEKEVNFALSLIPIKSIETSLDISEEFYDFEVEDHHNYLAGNNGFVVTHNCGIGYEFSSLRPKGAFVHGAGASTSGPLSFMDVYDKMCLTIMSAGGRRGAQMATFDISHPDILDFIKAKREDGRLRQFNLSILITDEFVEAVKNDKIWELKWNNEVFNTIKARDLWEVIMKSTYDYAEPGFLLVDKINKMNNLWFTESIRATNPLTH